MKELTAKIYSRSILGVRVLRKIFKAMDEASRSNLDVDDFRWGLMDFGI